MCVLVCAGSHRCLHTSLNTVTSLLPTIANCRQSPRGWWHLTQPSLSGVILMDSTVLNRFFAGSHGCGKFMKVTLSHVQELSFLPLASPSSSSSVFSDSSSPVSPSLRGNDTNYLWPSIPRSPSLSPSISYEFYINWHLMQQASVMKTSRGTILCV